MGPVLVYMSFVMGIDFVDMGFWKMFGFGTCLGWFYLMEKQNDK